MTYDAEGNLLVKKLYDSADLLLHKLDYIGNFEFVNGALETIHHSQGRLKSEAPNVFHQEYKIADHLGNTRIVYTDANNDGIITADEVIDEYQYYAFGMEQEIYTPTNTTNDYRYRYNGIERVEDLDVDIDMAFYRGLDPTIGRWLQVDPKAEKFAGMSPYNSMANNPLSFSDPNGDEIITAMLIGAGIGVLSQGIGNTMNNQGFFNDWWKGAITGAVGGALGQFGGGSLVSNLAWGAGEGAVTGGLNSALNGGNFLDGALNGAKWGAAFAAGTSGIEAAGNAIDGHGFRLNEGVIKNYTKKGQFQDAIDFVQDKFGLDGVTFKYDSKLTGAYGVTPPVGRDLVDIGPAAFTSPDLLKATMVHEYGHAILDKIKTASGGFSKWAYAPGAFPAIDATLAADGPLGYAQEIYSAGRMKIGLKALNTDNPLWNEWSRSLGGGSKWKYVLPMRFQNKALIKWY